MTAPMDTREGLVREAEEHLSFLSNLPGAHPHRIARIREALSGAAQAPTNPSWRCFHCDEVFTDPKAAANHFGVDHAGNETLCQMAQVDGGIARVIADLAEELQGYRMEDNTSYREFYALGADHRAALIKEEQKGYDRGLADARAEASLVSSTDGGSPPSVALEALTQAKAALIKIRAASIAGCEEGYGKPEKWADALFASHADVHAAIKSIDAALTLPQPGGAVAGTERGATE